MGPSHGTGLVSAAAEIEAQGVVGTGVCQRPFKPTSANTQTIVVQIIGHDTASGEGLTVRARSPVLALCRKLVAAGYDPATPLQAYRGPTLCLGVRTIGEGAKMTVRESGGDGRPRFATLNGDVGSLARQSVVRS